MADSPDDEYDKKEQRNEYPSCTVPNGGDIEAHIAVERADIKRNKRRYHPALLAQQILLNTKDGVKSHTVESTGVITVEIVERS